MIEGVENVAAGNRSRRAFRDAPRPEVAEERKELDMTAIQERVRNALKARHRPKAGKLKQGRAGSSKIDQW